MKTRRQQNGAALLILLSILLLTATYAWYRSAHASKPGRAELHARLQQAKEALIARAVTDANRPGSLPCPDLITDDNGLSNHPNDGKADSLTRNDCPSYVGWLPWVTLDLPELTDHGGSRLWYVLARALRDDDAAQPINSDTVPALSLDGQGDIAALIIAPGAAVNGQNRPANHVADYLEGSNALAGNAFVSGPASDSFNDVVLALSRQELMSAVEKRVASEVHRCLEQHATASANLEHDYPWPAPFSSRDGRGLAGSHFGQVPLSQPGPGPQAQLAASNQDLQASRSQLGSAANPGLQLAALQTLNEQLAYAIAFYDRLYSTAKALALSAQSSTLTFGDLDNLLLAANSNGRISATEKKNIQSNGNSAQNQLTPLHSALLDSGMDAFPDELASRTLALQSALDIANNTPGSANLGQLTAASNALLALLGRSHTPNSDIASALDNALALSTQAVLNLQNAAAAPGDTLLLNAALAATGALKNASERLQGSIADHRVALHPSEITARTQQLGSALDTFTHSPDSAAANTLNALLDETRAVITRIDTRASNITLLRSNSLNALNAAISAGATLNNEARISSSREALTQAETLANAIAQLGDNLTQESLSTASQRFSSQLNNFNTAVTRTQAEMVPYAENLRLAAVDVQFWAEIITRQAGNIATLARKSPEAGKTQNHPNAAYTLADLTLTSINKSTGSLKKLQEAIDDPKKSSKQTAATVALNETLSQLDTLLSSLINLGQNLHSNPADAFPMLWYGSRCAFLQPASDNTSWWLANQWSRGLFFQISRRTRATAGQLTVNGTGQYHSIVISAGPAIGPLDRQTKRSLHFFEDRNADPSRDGDAHAPSPHFISRPSGPDFNDRLAF